MTFIKNLILRNISIITLPRVYVYIHTSTPMLFHTRPMPRYNNVSNMYIITSQIHKAGTSQLVNQNNTRKIHKVVQTKPKYKLMQMSHKIFEFCIKGTSNQISSFTLFLFIIFPN